MSEDIIHEYFREAPRFAFSLFLAQQVPSGLSLMYTKAAVPCCSFCGQLLCLPARWPCTPAQRASRWLLGHLQRVNSGMAPKPISRDQQGPAPQRNGASSRGLSTMAMASQRTPARTCRTGALPPWACSAGGAGCAEGTSKSSATSGNETLPNAQGGGGRCGLGICCRSGSSVDPHRQSLCASVRPRPSVLVGKKHRVAAHSWTTAIVFNQDSEPRALCIALPLVCFASLA